MKKEGEEEEEEKRTRTNKGEKEEKDDKLHKRGRRKIERTKRVERQGWIGRTRGIERRGGKQRAGQSPLANSSDEIQSDFCFIFKIFRPRVGSIKVLFVFICCSSSVCDFTSLILLTRAFWSKATASAHWCRCSWYLVQSCRTCAASSRSRHRLLGDVWPLSTPAGGQRGTKTTRWHQVISFCHLQQRPIIPTKKKQFNLVGLSRDAAVS